MRNLIFNLFIAFGAMFFTAVTMPAFAVPNTDGKEWGDGWVQGDPFPGGGGSFGGNSGGGSWGNSNGFGGNGGSSNNGGISATCAAESEKACKSNTGMPFIRNYVTPTGVVMMECGLNGYVSGYKAPCPPVKPPEECPADMHWDGSNCVKDLKCPQGYEKQGDKCVWQCPAGYKELGGSCVKDDQPEDCDPAIQQCDENGEPQCMCKALRELVNLTNTQINNDNRVISLTETMTSNQNITNNNLNNVNNNLNVINNNMSIVNNNIKNINESVNNVITAIENNKPDFDTTALENKIDEVITAITNTGGGGGGGEPTDLTALLQKLDEMHQSIIDNKYDDAELKAKIDELINKDLSEITDRQDEQIGLLEDIKRLLMPTNEAGDPDYGIPEPDEFNAHLDPWSAIRGFDVNQNMINAQAQCPSGDAYSFTFLGKSFVMPMQILCGYLGQIGVGIMFLAYISGAFIIVKGD